jgi:hypothetical protein
VELQDLQEMVELIHQMLLQIQVLAVVEPQVVTHLW